MHEVITTDDIGNFYKQLCERSWYDSTDNSVIKIEWFLIYWLNGEEYPDKEKILLMLYEKFRNHYSYNGILYRGIEIDRDIYKEEGLASANLTSYTDQEEVALSFAGKSKVYGLSQFKNMVNILVEVEAQKAFALDEFLLAIQKKTKNVDLDITIDERIWENEKIYPFESDKLKISILGGLAETELMKLKLVV